MHLTSEGCTTSTEVEAAMRRGLEVVGAPEVNVITTSDAARVVERLEPENGSYSLERGMSGVVAAKTIETATGITIVINHAAIVDRPLADIERLLAHEGGHAMIHTASEAAPRTNVTSATTGPALLRYMAAITLEEYRIEGRLAQLGYPVAEKAVDDALGAGLFEMEAGVLSAVTDPRSEDVRYFAHQVLAAVQTFAVCLAYRAGAVAAGGHPVQIDAFGPYEQRVWSELLARNWTERLQLYSKVPPAGQTWGGSGAATHLRQATEIERRLVRAVGFGVSGETSEGGRWAFRREVEDEALTRRLKLFDAECERAVKKPPRN